MSEAEDLIAVSTHASIDSEKPLTEEEQWTRISEQWWAVFSKAITHANQEALASYDAQTWPSLTRARVVQVLDNMDDKATEAADWQLSFIDFEDGCSLVWKEQAW